MTEHCCHCFEQIGQIGFERFERQPLKSFIRLEKSICFWKKKYSCNGYHRHHFFDLPNLLGQIWTEWRAVFDEPAMLRTRVSSELYFSTHKIFNVSSVQICEMVSIKINEINIIESYFFPISLLGLEKSSSVRSVGNFPCSRYYCDLPLNQQPSLERKPHRVVISWYQNVVPTQVPTTNATNIIDDYCKGCSGWIWFEHPYDAKI